MSQLRKITVQHTTDSSSTQLLACSTPYFMYTEEGSGLVLDKMTVEQAKEHCHCLQGPQIDTLSPDLFHQV